MLLTDLFVSLFTKAYLTHYLSGAGFRKEKKDLDPLYSTL